MSYFSKINLHHSSSTLILICGSLATGIGFVALLGWLAGLPILSSLASGRIPMAPSTALLFMLYGLGVILLSRSSSGRPAFRIGLVMGAACELSSLLLFILSAMGIHLEAEHLGLRIDHAFKGMRVGHISPVSAFCFLLAGLSFLLLLSSPTGRTKPVSVAFCSSVLVVLSSLVFLLAYILGSPLLYGSVVIPPSLPASLGFLFLGIALLAYSGQRIWPHGTLPDMADTRSAYVHFMIFILLVAGTITAGYLYLCNYEKEYRIGVEQQLSSIARLKVSSLEQYRKERFGDAFLIYQNDQFSDLVRHFLANPEDAYGRIQIHTWLKKLQDYYKYNEVRLLDAGGVTRLSAPAGLRPVSAVIARRVSDVLRTREIAFQDFYLDEDDHRPYLSLIVPVLDTIGDKRAIGAVTLRIDPETYLYPFIRLWPTSSKTAETLIIRREGSDVLFLNDLRFRKNPSLTLRIPLERKEVIAVQAALGRNGIVEGIDYAGTQVLADVRAVPDSPWVLVARMSIAEINAPLRQQLWLITALISVLFIGAGSGVALLWRQQHVRFYRERYVAAEELLFKNIILSTQQECAIDGILVVDEDAAVISYNRRFVEMWGIPPELVEARDDASLLLFVANQPVDPEGFMTRVRYLYDHREEKSREEIALQDGRVFDRYSAPMIGTDGKFYGRIWYFRDITERKRADEELQRYSSELVKSNKELQDALANIKTLGSMLPICASCKKIRDDKGYWSQVETYISAHTETLFSSCICPECEKEMYAELEKLKKEMT